MDLKLIRKEINRIDDDMKKLFDARLDCSAQVASVKMKEHGEVFQPLREKEIEQRFAGQTWYLSYMKKVIALSRKYQYGQFVDAGQIDAGFAAYLRGVNEANEAVLREGGILTLAVRQDKEGLRGLGISDVLLVISDAGLEPEYMGYDGKTEILHIELRVEDNAQQRREAYILAYMLYKETLRADGSNDE